VTLGSVTVGTGKIGIHCHLVHLHFKVLFQVVTEAVDGTRHFYVSTQTRPWRPW
jgi:hypothetical protein